jgi:outer membrane protein OmpA-like peptidoglycan-associated protein
MIAHIAPFLLLFLLLSKESFSQINASHNGHLVHSTEVYFDFGKHDLRPASDSTLDQVAQMFFDKNNRHIIVTAHTDSIGSIENNIALSERRANSVMGFLSENGIPDSLMKSSVFGESQPVTSNRTDDGRQLNRRATVEVFERQPMTTLKGQIKLPEEEQFMLAEVIIRGKSFRDSLTTDSTGFFQTEVPTGAIIGVDVIAKGYFLESKMMKVKPGVMPLLEIMMRPAEVGEVADIENLYFVGNQDTLLPKSLPTLPKLLRFMQVNKCLVIEIAGHINHPNTPPLPEGTWEYGLSERRAKRVYKYLLENGIPEERMTWKGYSNWEMRYPHARSEEQQAANRRVEIRVTGIIDPDN